MIKGLKIKLCMILILTGTLFSSVAYTRDFSIDQEFQVRKLSEHFSKKYGMKINVKREDGRLLVKFWDKGFFKNDWKLTAAGASFVRRLSKKICVNEKECDVLLKTHHAENSFKNSSRLSLVKSQYKLVSVSWQILKSKISPKSLLQMSLGDKEPLVDPDKNESSNEFNIREMNTRTEIAFIPKSGVK
ncbi:MAG: hypothetical protein ACRBBP_00030 [Bdellovibrionales bacterium]